MAIINTDYKIGLKREVITALKPLFEGDNFVYEDLRSKVYVGLEYPMREVTYPAIYITYSEDELRNVGISHLDFEYVEGDNVYPRGVKHWLFSGRLNFNILALSALDRDRLASALISVLAFSDIQPEFESFWNEIRDNDYVAIQPLFDRILSTGDQIGAVPWDSPDQLQYGVQYSITLFGEFWSDPETLELIQIEQVDVYPYRLGEQAAPWD
jgi:hypothetical protein